MRYPWLRLSLAGCAFLCAGASYATSYKITNTADSQVSAARVGSGDNTHWQVSVAAGDLDGKCSLREALYAIDYQQDVDSCAAGTGNDSIQLIAGETYVLTHGSLPVGGGKRVTFSKDANGVSQPSASADDALINPSVNIKLFLDVFEKPDKKPNAVISAGSNSRLLTVNSKASLTLSYLNLVDGNAGTENGGLIYNGGALILADRTVLENGKAVSGGAIYLDQNSALSFTKGSRFENNQASLNGSVIATAATFNGLISGYRFYMGDNVSPAGGGTIYLNGASAKPVALGLTDGTMTGNSGGVIKVLADTHLVTLENMTIAFNDGVALDLPETVFADPANAQTTDQILHTALIGNSGGECAGTALSGGDAADARLLFTITDDSGCPTPQEAVPVTNYPNQANSDVLIGVNADGNRTPCAVNAMGAGSCTPMPAALLGGPFAGFLPNPTPSGYDPAMPADTASLFDRANPENVAQDQCDALDMRGESRGGAGGRCDVGAVEFLRALAQADEINLISGQQVLADVVQNDLNDSLIDCSRVPSGKACMEVLVPPEKGSVAVQIDANHYPRLLYTPFKPYQGVDSMRYLVAKEAFVGGADANQDQNEQVNFVSDPASGLTDDSGILDGGGGSWGPGLLIIAVIAGLWRRKTLCLAGILAIMTGQVYAADIQVNSLADHNPSIKNDGLCTLREALGNAAGGDPSTDCAYGGKGGDRILLPAGTINLVASLTVEAGAVTLEGKGALDTNSSDNVNTYSRIRGDGSFRLIDVQAPPGNGYPSVTLRYLELSNGFAANANGGALLTGGSISLDRVVVSNSHADLSGGAIFVRANAGNKKTITLDHSFFSGNSAGVDGGVFSTVAQDQETVTLTISNSTFTNNSAQGQGGAIDANLAQGPTLSVLNSTFFKNHAPSGSAIDLSGMAVGSNLMNLTVVANDAGNGIELGASSAPVSLSNSVVADSGSVCDSAGATVFGSSEFNLFSTPLCSDSSSSNQSDSGAAGHLASSLKGAKDGAAAFVPPYLPVVNAATDTLVVDAGDDSGELATGTASPRLCRATDLRGVSRTSGGRCDRGAYEYRQITAADDEGSNRGTPDRRVVIDILGNDFASENGSIDLLDNGTPRQFLNGNFHFEDATAVPNGGTTDIVSTGESFQQDPDIPTRYTLSNGSTIDFVWRYYNDSLDGRAVRCGDPLPQTYIDNHDNVDNGAVADDCIVLYTPANDGFIPGQADPSQDQVCIASKENTDPPKLYYLYDFTDSNGITSGKASVSMSISNKPPIMESESKRNKPGQALVFTINVSDPDGSASSIDWNSLRIKQEPSFTKVSTVDSHVEGVGLILHKPAYNQVTYIPEGNFDTFTDKFSLLVDDNCGTSSNAGTFTVTYVNKDKSAGTGGGASGIGMLAGLLLLARRRRKVSQSRC
ncbi:MAG: choice-of-anchor Q domain-containing protein [Alcanivorax sp.]|nr:choice-of-anchor Q domain-containing protein [Alcanivorax sp.]